MILLIVSLSSSYLWKKTAAFKYRNHCRLIKRFDVVKYLWNALQFLWRNWAELCAFNGKAYKFLLLKSNTVCGDFSIVAGSIICHSSMLKISERWLSWTFGSAWFDVKSTGSAPRLERRRFLSRLFVRERPFPCRRISLSSSRKIISSLSSSPLRSICSYSIYSISTCRTIKVSRVSVAL